MKWLKVIWHFILTLLPRLLHIAAHEVKKAHEDCPVCKDYPPKDRPDCEFLDNLPDCREEYPYMDYSDYCRNCEFFVDCKAYSDFVERGA